MADMTGKVVVVTGATNGIGEATALELARMGARMVVISRNPEKCAATVARIKDETGNTDVTYYAADLSAQGAVREVAAKVKADFDRLDVLVNNAGMWFTERKLSADGLEMTWALNHLGYFLITHELLPLLTATAEAHGEARVVSVSSMAHAAEPIYWDDIQFEDWERARTDYPGWGCYAQSKFANMLFGLALARRLEGTGVTSNVVHPGVVVTGFSQNNGWFYQLGSFFRRIWNRATALEGATPSIYCASAPEMRGVSGKYYGPPQQEETPVEGSHDVAQQDRLWALSEKMVGLAAPVA
jgi:retinol dehydrogenase-12